MTLSNAVLLVGILLGIAYFAMALVAYSHVRKEKRGERNSNRLLALTLWWPFYADMYDDSTRRLCRWGKIVMAIAAATYVTYFLIR